MSYSIAHKDQLLASSPAFVKNSIGTIPADTFYRDVALVHFQVDALRRLGDEAAALRSLKEALARREAVVGAAKLARYYNDADGMVAKNDHGQALTYLRNALNLVAQQEGAMSRHADSEVVPVRSGSRRP